MKIILIAAFILGLMFVIGSQDYKDELQQQSEYCKNVKSGVWPDYQGTFKKECK